MLNHDETQSTPHKIDDNLGCLNHECPSHKECWRFMHGNCDGEFEPRLNSDRCDWFKEINTVARSAARP